LRATDNYNPNGFELGDSQGFKVAQMILHYLSDLDFQVNYIMSQFNIVKAAPAGPSGQLLKPDQPNFTYPTAPLLDLFTCLYDNIRKN